MTIWNEWISQDICGMGRGGVRSILNRSGQLLWSWDKTNDPLSLLKHPLSFTVCAPTAVTAAQMRSFPATAFYLNTEGASVLAQSHPTQPTTQKSTIKNNPVTQLKTKSSCVRSKESNSHLSGNLSTFMATCTTQCLSCSCFYWTIKTLKSSLAEHGHVYPAALLGLSAGRRSAGQTLSSCIDAIPSQWMELCRVPPTAPPALPAGHPAVLQDPNRDRFRRRFTRLQNAHRPLCARGLLRQPHRVRFTVPPCLPGAAMPKPKQRTRAAQTSCSSLPGEREITTPGRSVSEQSVLSGKQTASRQ